MNFQNLYDYGLLGDITVSPVKGDAPIKIRTADFFQWLLENEYIVDYNDDFKIVAICVDDTGMPVFEDFQMWWADPRIIISKRTNPRRVDILNALLCKYLNSQK